MGRGDRGRATVYMIVANTIWGFSFLGTKYALNAGMPPMTLAALRYLIALPPLFLLLRVREPGTRLRREDIKTMALSGFTGVSLYHMLEFTGMQYLSSSTASLLLAAIPVLTLLSDAILLKKPVRRMQWIGVLLSILGVYLVVASSAQDPDLWKGAALLLLASVVWVAYIHLSGGLHERYSSVAVIGYQGLFGLVALAPLSLLEMPRWQPVPLGVWGAIAALAIVCTGVCYVLYIAALPHLGAIAVATYVNLTPIVAVVAGAVVLGEPVGMQQVVGGALILSSLAFVTLAARRGSA